MATKGLWSVRVRLKDVLTYAEHHDKPVEQKFLDEDLFATLKYALTAIKRNSIFVNIVFKDKHCFVIFGTKKFYCSKPF